MREPVKYTCKHQIAFLSSLFYAPTPLSVLFCTCSRTSALQCKQAALLTGLSVLFRTCTVRAFSRHDTEDLFVFFEGPLPQTLFIRLQMSMCCQIACGLEHLAKVGVVHRDLASRNCVVSSHLLVKISVLTLNTEVFET